MALITEDPHDHRRDHPPALRGAVSEQPARAGAVNRAQLAQLSPRIWCYQPDLHVGPDVGGQVWQGDDPGGPARQGDRVGQDTRAGRVEHRVDWAQRADPAGHAGAIAHRRGAQIAGQRLVVLAYRANHRDPARDRELCRDDADGSAAAEQQRLPALDVQLPEDTGGRLGRAGQHGSGTALR